MTSQEFWGLPNHSRIVDPAGVIGEVSFASESLARVNWSDGTRATVVKSGFYCTPPLWYSVVSLAPPPRGVGKESDFYAGNFSHLLPSRGKSALGGIWDRETGEKVG